MVLFSGVYGSVFRNSITLTANSNSLSQRSFFFSSTFIFLLLSFIFSPHASLWVSASLRLLSFYFYLLSSFLKCFRPVTPISTMCNKDCKSVTYIKTKDKRHKIKGIKSRYSSLLSLYFCLLSFCLFLPRYSITVTGLTLLSCQGKPPPHQDRE